MQIQNNRKIDFVSRILLYASPVAGVLTFYLVQKAELADVLSDVVIALVLTGIYATFLHINQNYLYQKISRPLWYFGSLFLSCILLGGSSGIPFGGLWMLAVVVAALSSGVELAITTHVVLMVQYAILRLPLDNGFYHLLAYILLGLVISLLFSQLKEKKAIPYLALILVTCDGVLQCVVYQFDLLAMRAEIAALAVEFVSILVFVGIASVYLLKVPSVEAADRQKKETQEAVEPVAEAVIQQPEMAEPPAEIPALQEVAVAQEKETEGMSVFGGFLEPGHDLLERLKAYSDTLYAHSERISVLSEKAAQAIGGNAEVAKVAGMYHEIGRIEKETDYIEEGIKLGRAYGFPEELLTVMRQHSTGFELPKSPEAAVVMMSDCIVSTSDYLEKNGKRGKISDEHLIQTVFQNRLDKGNLAQSGMTEEQIQLLKEFYMKNTF